MVVTQLIADVNGVAEYVRRTHENDGFNMVRILVFHIACMTAEYTMGRSEVWLMSRDPFAKKVLPACLLEPPPPKEPWNATRCQWVVNPSAKKCALPILGAMSVYKHFTGWSHAQVPTYITITSGPLVTNIYAQVVGFPMNRFSRGLSMRDQLLGADDWKHW